jgi:hypothetical protein
MPAGCCGSGTSPTRIESGDGARVTGSGSLSNPYVVALDLPDLAQSVTVRDTDTVNMTLNGSGNPGDPFIISGDVQGLKLSDLSDVDDPQGPSQGDVMLFVVDPVTGKGAWQFSAPPATPAGATNTSHGIGGNGTSVAPLSLRTSGVWGQGQLAGLGADSSIGGEVYVDDQGLVRTAPSSGGGGTGGSTAWSQITGKPSTFPAAPHSHPASVINNPQALDVGKIGGHRVFSQQGTPASPEGGFAVGDIWITW